MPLVDSLRHDFGERSLPAIVSTIVSLHDLDDNLISMLVCVDAVSFGYVTELYSSIGVDGYASMFLRVAEAVHDRRTGQTAAKRRRYNDNADDTDVNNTASMYSQQNQSWPSAADYHKQQQRR